MTDCYDVVIVGSGIAGLYAALLAAPHCRVLLVTKGGLEESNTRYAQGGIAVALGQNDSPELHLRDTIAAGDGLCDSEAVSILTHEAPTCILDLLDRGVPFDREGDGLAWTLEAAHSLPRVLHAGGDATGASVERTLASAVRAAGVTVRERSLCTSLLRRDRSVQGVTLLDEFGEPETITSGAVVLATGGAGQLFSRTTNPAVATGDGLALAYRAGAQLMDLEFVQFHPTALAIPDLPSFLISEAVRGEGGILRDAEGRAFMGDFHPDRELAPRDVVARAIHQQMIRSNSPNVWLDITHLPVERVEARFPSILRFCRDHGIDPTREPIPVSPAAHYLMGGVRTDVWGRTSLPGLYACGEVACTGVHGANRLASNSLLEGLVFARRAVQSILRGDGGAPEMASGPRLTTAGFRVDTDPETPVSRPELAAVMWRHASLVRSAESLRQASAQIGWPGESPHPQAGGVRGTVAQHELANLTLLGRLILRAASLREESRGAHFRADFPTRDPAWQGHIVLSGDDAWLAEQQPIGAARG